MGNKSKYYPATFRNTVLAGTSLKLNFVILKDMEMNTQKIDQRIQQNLFSANNQVVISAISEIKEKGNSLYLPLLFEVLTSGPDKEVEKEITELLGTVKEKDSTNTFMRAVEDKRFESIRKSILVACWQNGLDFSTFLPVFVDLVINEEWEVAFEAFTVIDNLEFLPTEAIVNIALEKIRHAQKTANAQKQYFLNEIVIKLQEQ